MKSTITTENTLKGLKSRFELAEEIISKFEERSVVIMKPDKQRGKKIKINRASEKCGTLLSAP